jgi:choline dehydrogenase
MALFFYILLFPWFLYTSNGIQNTFFDHLSSLLDPFGTVLAEIFSGDGVIDGNLGLVEGVLGVEDTFDYIVVGGGTAGNAIGTRLAQGGHSVAILEAGQYYQIGKPVFSTAPGGALLGTGTSLLDSDPLVDWEFVTQPQPGVNDRQTHYPRGKCLGGS